MRGLVIIIFTVPLLIKMYGCSNENTEEILSQKRMTFLQYSFLDEFYEHARAFHLAGNDGEPKHYIKRMMAKLIIYRMGRIAAGDVGNPEDIKWTKTGLIGLCHINRRREEIGSYLSEKNKDSLYHFLDEHIDYVRMRLEWPGPEGTSPGDKECRKSIEQMIEEVKPIYLPEGANINDGALSR